MSYDWNTLDKNLIVQIALELNLPDILSLCRSNKRFNETVCESDIFWRKKLVADFGITAENPKSKYRRINNRVEDYINFLFYSAGPVLSTFTDRKTVKDRFLKDLKKFTELFTEEDIETLEEAVEDEDYYEYVLSVLDKDDVFDNSFDKYMGSYDNHWDEQYNAIFEVIKTILIN